MEYIGSFKRDRYALEQKNGNGDQAVLIDRAIWKESHQNQIWNQETASGRPTIYYVDKGRYC
jgi:hypothetical protein